MSHEDSVTEWMEALQHNDDQAAHKLWERYFQRLVRLARRQLNKTPPRGAYDEEDIALSVFNDFCLAAQDGKFPELQDRGELWSLLATITLRKARANFRRDSAQKRAAERTLDEGALGEGEALNALTSRETSPDLQVLMAEQCQTLLDQLDDDKLKQTAIWKLDGYTNEEIADRLGCARRSVQRMLKLIRSTWGTEM